MNGRGHGYGDGFGGVGLVVCGSEGKCEDEDEGGAEGVDGLDGRVVGLGAGERVDQASGDISAGSGSDDEVDVGVGVDSGVDADVGPVNWIEESGMVDLRARCLGWIRGV